MLLALAYVLVLAIVALLVPLGLSLRDRVDAEVRLQSRSQAEVVAARASAVIGPADPGQLSTIAREGAREVRGRVVIVGLTGRVLADSADTTTVSSSYRSRPEIARALRGETSQERRESNTLGEEILATAVPIVESGRTAGAVRVTQSVAAVNRAVHKTWLGLGVIALLVLGLGLAAGLLVARRITRPILRLDAAARTVAEGDLSVRAAVEGSTEQQALARSFNSMTERLAVLLTGQREFVADASHQLRTPLAGLRLRLEEAQAESTTPEEREQIDAAIEEVDRLALIVSELLELSRAGEDRRAAATTDTASAVERAATRWSGPAADVASSVTLMPPSGTTVVGHERDLDRILDVLIENAIAYAPGTEIVLDAGGPVIRVRDHGPGLAAGEQDAIFERFHRGRAGHSGTDGTGLGLAIARDLARRWGGDVTLENAPGGGALATVELALPGLSPDLASRLPARA